MDSGLQKFLKMIADLYPTGPHQLLLKNGEDFNNISPETFKHKDHGPQKKCFMNAGRAAMAGQGIYCEGYTTYQGVPMEHAWIITGEDRKVKDLTLKSQAGVGGYFGIPFTTEFLTKITMRTRKWGLLGHETYHQINFTNFKEEKYNKLHDKDK